MYLSIYISIIKVLMQNMVIAQLFETSTKVSVITHPSLPSLALLAKAPKLFNPYLCPVLSSWPFCLSVCLPTRVVVGMGRSFIVMAIQVKGECFALRTSGSSLDVPIVWYSSDVIRCMEKVDGCLLIKSASYLLCTSPFDALVPGMASSTSSHREVASSSPLPRRTLELENKKHSRSSQGHWYLYTLTFGCRHQSTGSKRFLARFSACGCKFTQGSLQTPPRTCKRRIPDLLTVGLVVYET